MTLLTLAVSVTLAAIAAIHLYWAAGGRRGVGAVVPEVDGTPLFAPSPAATVAVAIALSVAGALVLAQGGVVPVSFSPTLLRWATVALSAVFLVRAAGDLHYVGFFKRVRDTRFARADTLVYSPLCLALAVALAVLSLRAV